MLLLFLLLLLLLLLISLSIKIIFVILLWFIIIIRFYVVTICFVFDRARLWWDLEVWQISGNVKNRRDGGNHEVDENDDNTFTFMYICASLIYLFILFIHSFICLFMYFLNYLFIISFKLLKLRWISLAKRESFR